MQIVGRSDLSRRVLASRDFKAFALADIYRDLSVRFGHDFSPAVDIIERLPTFVSGESHKRLRASMARANAQRSPAQIAAVAEYLHAFQHRLSSGRVEMDLLADFALPIFRAIGTASLGPRDDAGAIVALAEQIPHLFSTFTSLRQRLEINEDIRSLMAKFGDEFLDDFALLVLGARPLPGALALSLHAIFRENCGTRTGEISWPDHFTHSPLPYADRVSLRPVSIDGEAFEPDQRVRCPVQSPDWTPAENRSLMFGTGSHLCLGRGLSERIWAMVVDMFVAADCLAEAGELEMSMTSEPFDFPVKVGVTFEMSPA